MMCPLYAEPFYGDGEFYAPSSIDVPLDLRFYRTNVDNVYVFHWGFQSAFVSPILSTLDFELQLDTVTTFNSPNLTTFTSSSAIDFQNGDVRKGYAVPVSPRQDKTTQQWFARVRTVLGTSTSDFSFIRPFTILEKFEVEDAESLLDSLPDFHVYNKEDIRLPVLERKTNLYTVMNMYSKELDQAKLENTLTATNITIDLCRDEQLFQNFGVFFDYDKPQLQEFVEYRECLRNLILGALNGSTIDAINRVVSCFTGLDPVLELIRNRNDFFLTTIFETPPETPNGAITAFSTSQTYIPGSLVVLQQGTVLSSGVDFTEDLIAPGFNMTVAPPGGDILQVFFQIGLASDPEPLVFDIEDTTTLTGTVTFTNGSTAVTGVSTLFTSELSIGTTITDDEGLVLGVVDSIGDDFNLVLVESWIGTTGANSSAAKLAFGESEIPPSILWDTGSLAHGVIINVVNPGAFVLPQSLIIQLVTLLLPAHIKAFFLFP